MSREWRKPIFAPRTTHWLSAATFRATAIVRSRSSSAGTASLTSRISSARRPSKCSPVMMKYIASLVGTVSASARVTRVPGVTPQFTSEMPNTASSAAMARSQETMGTKAPPKHQPLTIAIVGFV